MRRLSWLMITSAAASVGAGAIHAAAVGVHADARQASLVFVAIAAFQIGWGAFTLAARPQGGPLRALALIGLVGHAGLVVGWFLATDRGVSFVDGLETAHGATTSDTIAAVLAAIAAAAAIPSVVDWSGASGSLVSRPIGALGAGVVTALVAALTMPGLVAASDHGDHDHGDAAGAHDDDHDDDHDDAHDDDHDDAHAHDDDAHADDPVSAGSTDDAHDDEHAHDDSAHDDSDSAVPITVPTRLVEVCTPAADAPDVHEHDDGSTHEHDDGDSAGADDQVCEMVETSAYHPDLPIDLGGMAGVTPQQQAAAENLVAVSLALLPRYADVEDAIADGYYSFRDGSTGHEHFLNWDLVDDGRILDPMYPESLVYTTRNGERELVSAMFMLDSDDTLETVPDVGGALMQWHIHQDICMSEGEQPTLTGLRAIGGECANGVGFPDIPMIHVWIEPNECGPFAALKGIGAGQVAEGEETLCDHAHGSH